ncbi:hypothetical protein DPMN_071060 [Dreissena polymorpha]|uniref:Uncharacterized protein n=1 Tax=Dreissena polymorpha TaxID=45954 RepID=A0A9D4BPB5_DREPO|nr:hypothetical protein DPMN_071060 [Dreissena polymorpha]
MSTDWNRRRKMSKTTITFTSPLSQRNTSSSSKLETNVAKESCVVTCIMPSCSSDARLLFISITQSPKRLALLSDVLAR